MKRVPFFFILLVTLVLSGCVGAFTPGFGSIHVISEPGQARIYLDGQDTGLMTPAVLDDVPMGPRSIRVDFPGMGSTESTVLVPRDRTTTVLLTFEEPVLRGFVLGSLHGSGIVDAEVTVYRAGTNTVVASTETDRFGSYQFPTLPNGEYDIVATKDTRAMAKVQRVQIEADTPQAINLIQRQLFTPGKAAVAPTLTVSGVRAGDLITTPIEVTVSVNAAHPVDMIRAVVGRLSHETPIAQNRSANSLTFTLDPARYPSGETYVAIDTYDIQHNWSRIIIPIEFANAGPALPLPRIVGVDLLATTHGVDVGTFRLQRAALFEAMGESSNPDLLTLHNGNVINLADIRQDVTLYIEVSWPRTFEAFGYEVQRARSADGPWTTIGYRWAYESSDDIFTLTDTDGSLTPGREVFYRVRALGPNGEVGEFSTPNGVTPLERFEVYLVSPADNSVGVPLDPVFEWRHNGVGSNQVFAGVVEAVTNASGAHVIWEFVDENITSAPFNYDGRAWEPLQPAKQYAWNIYLAYGYTLYGHNSAAQSFSLRGLRDARDEWIGGGALNGEFTFVTTADI